MTHQPPNDSLLQPGRRGRAKGCVSEKRKYGTARTAVMRVPEGSQEKVESYLLSFDALIDDYKERSTGQRNWVEANRLLEELEAFRVSLATLQQSD